MIFQSSLRKQVMKMGTDCTMIIERKDMCLSNVDREWWDIIGCYHLNRNYKLFDKIREEGVQGYPSFMNYHSKEILDSCEDWGECFMSYKRFKKIAKKHHADDALFITKDNEEYCRCIFRFDN